MTDPSRHRLRPGERLRLWLRAVRPFSFPCSLLPFLVAAAAVAPLREWRFDTLGAVLAAVLSLHVAANLLNDYFDYVQGVDREQEDDQGRPGRLLVAGEIAPAQVLRGALTALGLVAASAVYLTWRVGPTVLAFYALALFGAYSYTGPPLRLKARGLGELTMLVFFGPGLVAGVAYVQVQRVTVPVLLISVPMGLAVSVILTSNNLRDFDEDAAGGVRTLAHRIGRRAAAWLYCAEGVACPAWMTAVGVACGRPLLALTFLSLLALAEPMRAVLSGRRLPDVDVRTAKFTAAFGLTAAAVLIYTGGL
jgi:1,4-dihydroxy-2-naphthoate octaprenyltransferase